MMNNVDVIIPVYKGLDETVECIISAFNSMPEWARLIVINDCSPEPKLTKWLRTNKEKYNYRLYENNNNLGFVATVNFGMKLNDNHDVLLLNSDVEVSKYNWLERIRLAAYTQDKVASITPFSNNATICSFPNFCQDNQLLDSSDVDELDFLFKNLGEDLNSKVVEVPTGVGFCMYIRRDCLDEVGYFDEKTFGKGYGEENDWCQRAKKKGWFNYHQLDVFAYHKGGVSFAEEGDPRKANALKLLAGLHPNYEQDVMKFIQLDPASEARIKALVSYISKSTKHTILNITHSLGGGVVTHLNELTEHLKHKAINIDLCPIDNGVVELSFKRGLAVNDIFKFNLKVEEEYSTLLGLLGFFGISLIHIHHLKGFTSAITRLINDIGCKYDITVHDYHLVNQNPTLTSNNAHFVGDKLTDTDLDYMCSLAYTSDIPCDQWRLQNQKLIDNARYVIFPSMDTKQRFLRWFNVSNSIVARHLDSHQLTTMSKIPLNASAEKKLTIGIIGAISREKGADLLEFVASRVKNVEFHLIGYAYRPLRGVVTYGPYNDDNELHHKITEVSPDVFWFPALWPETYSYTLSAALHYNKPIIAPNIGAFPERLQGELSAIMPWDTNELDYAKFWETFTLDACAKRPKSDNNYDVTFYRKSYLEELHAVNELDFDLNSIISYSSRKKTSNIEFSRREKILKALVKVSSNHYISYAINLLPFRIKKMIKRTLSKKPMKDFM